MSWAALIKTFWVELSNKNDEEIALTGRLHFAGRRVGRVRNGSFRSTQTAGDLLCRSADLKSLPIVNRLSKRTLKGTTEFNSVIRVGLFGGTSSVAKLRLSNCKSISLGWQFQHQLTIAYRANYLENRWDSVSLSWFFTIKNSNPTVSKLVWRSAVLVSLSREFVTDKKIDSVDSVWWILSSGN